MATSQNIHNEVICLLSDDEDANPSATEGKCRKGKGKEVLRGRSLSLEQQNEHASSSHMRGDDDPISSWGDPSWNATSRKTLPRGYEQLEEIEEVIVIEDSPLKPHVRPAPRSSPFGNGQDGTFSATTTSILAGLLEAKSSSDNELDDLDDLDTILGHRSRDAGTKKRERNRPEVEIQAQQGLPKPKRTKGDKESAGVYNPLGSPGKKKGKKLTEEEREQRAEEKARKAAEKEAEKIAKKLEKEAKALEKQKEQELDTVNKLKISKKDSAKEMIVDISASFAGSPAGQQLLRFLQIQGCESTVDWSPEMSNVVKWRRKVAANWDENLGYFVPIPEEIREESHILVVVSAEEFVDMAMGETSLDEHVTKAKSLLRRDGIKPIYVIEGLTALLRKSKNAKNRNFQGAVRQAITASSEGGSARRSRAVGDKKGKGPRIVDEDTVEDALLSLQITHGCLIHHTASMQETSEWISVFTGDISTIPYKISRMTHDTSFCADVGQVRTGNDVEDTYFKMLQEITRVTAGVANGIMGEYKSVRELMGACKNEGEAVVAHLEIMASNNGISSGRKIGQATSKRIHKFFTGHDPESVDV